MLSITLQVLQDEIQDIRQKIESLSTETWDKHTDNTHEDVSFDVTVCQRELRHFYRQSLCKIPQFPGVKRDYLSMDDIYTNVSILINLPKPCTPIQVSLKSHHQIFTPTENGVPQYRVLVLGNPGCGKSVLTLKLAYDWAIQNPDSPLKDLDLLFALNMRWMTPDTSLEDVIFQQLLPKDTKLNKTALREYITRNQSTCIILFDSYDEYGFRGTFSKQKSGVHDILSNDALRECQVLVTSRFWKSVDFDDLQDVYTQMQICGFSEEHVKAYVFKFFGNDKVAAEGLLGYLTDHNLNPGIANVPLMTLLFCAYWKESEGQNMPTKIGGLYSEVFGLLYRQYLSKSVGESIDVPKLIIDVGKIALSGLWSSEEELVFDFAEFVNNSSHETIISGCNIGLLSIEQQVRGAITTSPISNPGCITFFHKSCQEKCTGEYLTHIYHTNPSAFATKLQYLDSAKTCLRLEMVLRFACGVSSDVGYQILLKLIEIFKAELSSKLPWYYKESIGPDDTKAIQKFIELCLQCYYECPRDSNTHPHEQLFRLLGELFPYGQILFIGMSPYTSSAIGQYISHAKTIEAINIQAIPSPADGGIITNGVISTAMSLIQRTLKQLPATKLQKLYQHELKYSHYSDFFNLSKTELANYFSDWQSSHGINLVPIFTSLAYCDGLDTLGLTNVRLGNQMTILQGVINQGVLVALSHLLLFNNGLSTEQVNNLLDSVQYYLPKLVRLELSYNTARLTHLGDCLVNSQIQQLCVSDMSAPAEDMYDVISKLPQFGSRMEALIMQRNEIDDNTGKALTNALQCASQLKLLSFSMDMMKRNTHNKVIKAMHHLTHLTRLRIVRSPYLDDLFQCLSDTMRFLPQLRQLALFSSRGTSQQSSQSSLARFLPWLSSRGEQTTEGSIHHVKRSACQRFISRLDTMGQMRIVALGYICLHKEDLIALLDLCRRHNYTAFSFSRHLFPDDIDASQYEFLVFN